MMNPTTPNENEQPEVPATPVTPDNEAPVAAPATPVTPVTPVASANTAPSPAPKNNKKLIIIASAVAGVVLLAVIAIFVYIAMTSVSKQDYANAAKQYNEVSSANTALNRTVRTLGTSTSSGTDEEFAEDAKKVEEAIATLKTENEKLGNEKASKVGEGGELYKNFDTKLTAYAGYADELVVSIKTIRTSFKSCNEVSKVTEEAARAKALRECADQLNTEANIPNAEFKAYIDGLKPEYEKYAKSYEAMVALANPRGSDYDKYRELRTESLNAQTKIREVARTLSTALNERDDKMSVKDDAKALADYFNAQQRK